MLASCFRDRKQLDCFASGYICQKVLNKPGKDTQHIIFEKDLSLTIAEYLFFPEKSVTSCYAVIYELNSDSKSWKVAGEGGWSEVHLCHDSFDDSYRILGWTDKSHQVFIIYTLYVFSLKYRYQNEIINNGK